MNEKVLEVLQEVASGIGTTVDYLWPKWVQYSYASATANVVGTTIGFIILLTLFFVCMHGYKKTERYDDEGWIVGMGMTGIAAIVALMFSVSYLCTFIKAHIAPEGYALMLILEKLNGN